MKKTLLKGLVAVMMSMTLISTSFAAAPEKNDNVKITILGTSDVHGRFMPWEYAPDTANTAGSITQISTIVNQVRAENPNTILVDAGDSIQDNYVETFKDYPENPMVVAMNAMGYDTWTMGNHEFNFNQEILGRTLSQFKGTALAGNLYKEDGSRFLPAYKIVEKEGVKVGIIGITTPMIAKFEEDSNNLKGITVKNAVDETKKAIEELKGKADVLVGVMHMGEANENGIPGTGITDIANACPELDVIVAGHMHQNISSKEINGVLVTEPYKYGGAVSKVDLEVEKKGSEYDVKNKKAETISVKGVASDVELEKKLESFHKVLRDMVNQPIGKLVKNDLVPKNEIKDIPTIQVEATPLFNLFNEVAQYYSKAQVTALGTDNDNARLDVGDIKIKDIAYNYTYTGGEVTVYEMTGKDLKDYMEWSADYFNTLKDGDITVSFNPERRASKYSTNDFFGGVTYNIDLTKEKGNRITELKFKDGTKITPDTKLTLGMNSYRMEMLQKEKGPLEGRKFNAIYDSKKEFGEDLGTIRNLTIKYIKEVKKGVIEGDTTQNWKIVGVDKNSKEYKVIRDFANKGLIQIPRTADGKYTNVASINIKGKTNLTDAAYKQQIKKIQADYAKAKTPEEKTKIHNEAELLRALNNKN